MKTNACVSLFIEHHELCIDAGQFSSLVPPAGQI